MSKLVEIRHLYRRGGFGLSPLQDAALRNSSYQAAVNRMFDEASKARMLTSPISAEPFMALSQTEKNQRRDVFLGQSVDTMPAVRAEWINLMGNPDVSGLHEKMVLFWHGHFATHIRFGHTAVQQNNLIRSHALGNFGDLLRGMVKDPGLLHYLNNNLNTRQRLNENFGRELLELFTLGIGNYSQKDIVEASKAFTGWGHHEHFRFVIDPFFHDPGPKEFFGQKGNLTGDDIVDILLRQKQTARFISGKLYRFFVSPKPDSSRIEFLTEILFSSGFRIDEVMRAMFNASWFRDPRLIGEHIKSPIELLAASMRVLHAKITDPKGVFPLCEWLGQQLFFPPNVAGWPVAGDWISASSLFKRLNLVSYMAHEFLPKNHPVLAALPELQTDVSGIRLGLSFEEEPLTEVFGRIKPSKLSSALSAYLLPVPLPAPPPAIPPALSRRARPLATALAYMSIPEFQTN